MSGAACALKADLIEAGTKQFDTHAIPVVNQERWAVSRVPVARRRPAALASVLLLVTLTTACGSDDGDGPTGEPTTADGLTTPGTRFHVGDSATVPRSDGTGTIELTVTGIVEGTSQDLAGVGLADAAERTPYYVTYEMTVVSGDAYGMDMRHYLSAWSGVEQVGELVSFTCFPPCQEVNFPVDVAAGESVSSCRTYVTENGAAPVDRVQFDNDDTYEGGDGTAVDWTD
ncbi:MULTISPECIES: hypothetical protein [unclassified Nocardioides]|uniref:hypothetical protein n=1 Tax=unclassified Nocardioides TaxID=2615069 RepID=UPI0010563F7D|nr:MULTISPECIES: hypothetical protein [unclassified Nocardioides]